MNFAQFRKRLYDKHSKIYVFVNFLIALYFLDERFLKIRFILLKEKNHFSLKSPKVV
jgi:hypothetical protein